MILLPALGSPYGCGQPANENTGMVPKNDQRVLVLMADAGDAEAVCAVATDAGILVERCSTMDEVCAGIASGAGAAVMGQKALMAWSGFKQLTAALREQPTWSDFPIIVIALKGGWTAGDLQKLGSGLGNFVVLQRPLHVSVLITSLRSALRARRVQFEEQRVEQALRESEASLRALVSASSQVLYRMNADWSEMKQLLGGGFLTDTKALERNWMEKYIHPQDRPTISAAAAEAVRTKSAFELEHRVLRRDGSWGWTLSRAIPILDANGEIAEWFGAASDVTQRKEAEHALQESESRFRQLADAMPQLVWATDGAGRCTYLNRRWCEQTGFTEGESIGEGWLQALHPEDRKPTLENWRRCVETGDTFESEYRLHAADGKYRWYLGRAVAFREEGGRITGWFGTSTDIEESKRSEERKESERAEIYRQVMRDFHAGMPLPAVEQRARTAPDGIGRRHFYWLAILAVILGAFTMIISWNTYLDEVEHGKHVMDQVRSDIGRVAEQLPRLKLAEEQRALSVWIATVIATGGISFLLAMVILGAWIIWRRSARLAHALAENAHANEVYRLLIAKLQTAREEERSSLARELHDQLGHMLTGMHVEMANVKRLLRKEDLQEVGVRAQAVSDSISTTIQLTRRIAGDLRPAALDQIGLAEAIRADALEFQARSGIDVKLEEAPCDLALDSVQKISLFRIVQESLTNVARYAKASHVRIGIHRGDSVLTLTVHDDGVGFDRSTVPGESLGLLGMEERARLIGAGLRVESAPGLGTTVTVEMPLSIPYPTQ